MKNFDLRNRLKKLVDAKQPSFHILEREIRYAYLGVNIWFEEDGKGTDFRRPVLVLKKIGNVFAVLPMTTKGKDSKFYYRLPDRYFKKTSRVILSQGRVLDKARFIDKIGMLSEGDYNDVKEKLKALLL